MAFYVGGVRQRPRRLQEIDVVRNYEKFNCKATSAWFKCGRAKETAFTHKHLSPEKEEETSQLDNIIGPRRKDDAVHISNDVRTWATWDHCTPYMPGYGMKNKQKIKRKEIEEEVDRLETKE